MQLIRALPRWDRRERHRLPCDAPVTAVMGAAEEVTWREVPIFRGLMSMMPWWSPRFSADEPVLTCSPAQGSRSSRVQRTSSWSEASSDSPGAVPSRGFRVPASRPSGTSTSRAVSRSVSTSATPAGCSPPRHVCGPRIPGPGGSSASTGSSSAAAAASSGTSG